MVFCYKIITDTPRRSGHVSPGGHSPLRKLPNNAPSSLSRVLSSAQYEDESVLDSVPEREWRLLAALARKREEEREREELARQFRSLWERERLDRELVEAESGHQYKQYLSEKRSQEREFLEYKRLQLSAEQLVRRGQLLDSIRYKERRTRDLLATEEDKKASEILERALQEEARMAVAAERRARRTEAERCRRQLELQRTEQRAARAACARTDMLKHSAKKLAITSALSRWEAAAARRQAAALAAARRALHAHSAALAAERGAALAAHRERRTRRARAAAALTAQMRDDLRAGRGITPAAGAV